MDLGFVDALARLQLEAKRLGRTVRIAHPDEDLRALLELVGLAEVLLLEVVREPEGGEQLGVDEAVQGDDLPA